MTSLVLTSTNPLLQYTEEDVQKILARYNKTLENLEEDLQILKKWMKEQTHFPRSLADREFVSFLISTRFSVEDTKIKVQTNFMMKTVFPECYKFSTNDPKLINFANNYDIFPFPKLSLQQNRIHISKPEDKDFFNFDIFCSIVLHIHELRNLEDFAENFEYIIDLGKASAEMLARITPRAIQKLFLILEKVYSNRISAIHFINFHPFAETFLKIFKEAFRPEIVERIVIHQKVETLLEFYPKEILPVDLGGEERSLKELRDDWIKFMADKREYLDEVQNVGWDEKYFENLVTDEILNLQGDFKNLELD